MCCMQCATQLAYINEIKSLESPHRPNSCAFSAKLVQWELHASQMRDSFTNYRARVCSKDRKAVIQAVEAHRQSEMQAQANTQAQAKTQAQDTMLDNNQVCDMETDEETGASAMRVNAAASNSQLPDFPSQAADMQADATATLSVTCGHCRDPV